MKEQLSSVILFVRKRKFLVIGVVFLLAITFVGQSSLMVRLSQQHRIKEIQDKIEDYKDQIARDRQLLNDIDNDTILIEKIAREQFNMSRSDEDVFLIR